jgi:hypothetical protein
MRKRVRCPECHHWTDALLVWAAGDCCPACNAPIVGFDRADRPVGESDDERARPETARAPDRLPRPGLGSLSERPVNPRRSLNH